MSDWLNALWVIGLALPLWPLLARDRIKGLCYALFLCIAMPRYLRIETLGGLPEITIQRALLLVLLAFWLKERVRQGTSAGMPCRKNFLMYILAGSISLLGAVDYGVAIKNFLDTVFEVAAYFLVVTTFVRRREDGLRLLRAAWLATCLVGMLAVFEHYTGFRALSRIFPAYALSGGYVNDVVATFPHRILLGTALAMGWPLAVAAVLSGQGKDRRLSRLTIGILLAGCYFSMSRGPWLAAAGAGTILVWFGSKGLRKPLVWVGCLAVLVLLARPGVREGLLGRAQQTMDADSAKGGTFMYRLELWKIAAHEILKSPWRTLFGYGPGAGSVMHFDWDLSYRDSGRDKSIHSWDNQYAYDLFQTGFAGLLATFILYGGVAAGVLSRWRQTAQPEKDLLACVLASLAVMLFMRSNVLIYTSQLDYLFWSVAAAGFAVGGWYSERATLAEQPSAVPELTDMKAEGLEGLGTQMR